MATTQRPEDVVAADESAAPRSRIATATAVQMAARICGTAASLVTVSVTTRALGPESYGHLQAAIMFVALWLSLTELGINVVVVRRVTNAAAHSGNGTDYAELARLVRTNLGLSSLLCLPLTAVTILVGLLAYHDQRDVAILVVIIAGSLSLTTLGNSFDPVFLVRVRFAAVATADFLGRVGSMVLTIVLVATDAPLYWYAVVQLIPPACQMLIKMYSAGKVMSLRPVYSWSTSVDLIRESLPQTAILIIGMLYWRIDGVILSLLSNPAQVGVYGLAYTLAFTASMVPELFLSTTLSTSTELFARSRAEFCDFIRGILEVLYLIALPLVVLGAVLSGSLMVLVGSNQFSGGHSVLAMLFLAAAVTFINAAVSQALFAAHKQVFLMRLNLVTLSVNIIANLALVPSYGSRGAALALVITEVLGFLVVNIKMATMSLHVQPFVFILRCIPSLVVAAVIAIGLVEISVLLAGFCAALGYVGAQLIFGPARATYFQAMIARQRTPMTPATMIADEEVPT